LGWDRRCPGRDRPDRRRRHDLRGPRRPRLRPVRPGDPLGGGAPAAPRHRADAGRGPAHPARHLLRPRRAPRDRGGRRRRVAPRRVHRRPHGDRELGVRGAAGDRRVRRGDREPLPAARYGRPRRLPRQRLLLRRELQLGPLLRSGHRRDPRRGRREQRRRGPPTRGPRGGGPRARRRRRGPARHRTGPCRHRWRRHGVAEDPNEQFLITHETRRG
jgi:hypothetical protein